MGIKLSRHSDHDHNHEHDDDDHHHNQDGRHDDDHGDDDDGEKKKKKKGPSRSGGFRMPLHYPRYKKSDYERMSESELDLILTEYGLPLIGDVHSKRNFAIGAFLWPPHNDQTLQY